jgi:hypothetical protein
MGLCALAGRVDANIRFSRRSLPPACNTPTSQFPFRALQFGWAIEVNMTKPSLISSAHVILHSTRTQTSSDAVRRAFEAHGPVLEGSSAHSSLSPVHSVSSPTRLRTASPRVLLASHYCFIEKQCHFSERLSPLSNLTMESSSLQTFPVSLFVQP